jgi:hypothetical protein
MPAPARGQIWQHPDTTKWRVASIEDGVCTMRGPDQSDTTMQEDVEALELDWTFCWEPLDPQLLVNEG